MYYAKRYSGQTAQELFEMNYRQVSRRTGGVARPDKSWEEIKNQFIKENFGEIDSGLPSSSKFAQLGYYCRCNTKDKLRWVPDSVMKELRALHFANDKHDIW